ncbi:MAG TPA: hypothetical protein VE972_02125 [Conexibacter sp.]|nr:hypothetical protein [Conexibacter sp.]
MYRYSKVLLAALTAALLIGLTSQAAFALRSLQVERETTLQAEGTVTFGDRGLERMTKIVCRVRIFIMLERAIPKRRGAKVGKLTRWETDVAGVRCTWGELIRSVEGVRALLESGRRLEQNSDCRLNMGYLECRTTGGRPELWNLNYESILGTLPDITGVLVQIEKALFKIEAREIFGAQIVCLYEGNIFTLISIDERDEISALRILLSLSALRVRRLLGICPESGKIGGEFNPNTVNQVFLI